MSSSFFQNTDCEYFPCHKNIEPDNFNCLFCYCPLYSMKEKCGGEFYYSGKGIKVCTDCGFPHERNNYDQVLDQVKRLGKKLRKIDKTKE